MECQLFCKAAVKQALKKVISFRHRYYQLYIMLTRKLHNSHGNILMVNVMIFGAYVVHLFMQENLN